MQNTSLIAALDDCDDVQKGYRNAGLPVWRKEGSNRRRFLLTFEAN